MSFDKEVPPYVVFETRAEEDRDASFASGSAVMKDVDYALITPMGSKDRVERVVGEWLTMLEVSAKDGRVPPTWPFNFREAYNAWKSDNALPEEGTPIKNWAYLSPAQIKNLLNWHVTTIEKLSKANEETVKRLGMGGNALVAAAKDYLENNKDTNKAVAELNMLRAATARLTAENTEMAAKMERIMLQLKALTPPAVGA